MAYIWHPALTVVHEVTNFQINKFPSLLLSQDLFLLSPCSRCFIFSPYVRECACDSRQNKKCSILWMHYGNRI